MVSDVNAMPAVQAEREAAPPRARRDGPLLLACLLFPALCLGLSFRMRLADGFANTDDYLYSLQAKAIFSSVSSGHFTLFTAWRQFGTNSPLYPTLAAVMSPVADSPAAFLVAQIPLWMALLGAGYALTKEFTGSRRCGYLAVLVMGSLPPITGYAVMINFALVASATLCWACYAYIRSGQLQNRRWSAVLGLCSGLVLLSRVVAVVYVVALAITIAWDTRGRLLRDPVVRTNAVIAASITVVVAAPWWLVCGRSALHYLTNSGYSSSSGFAGSHSIPALLIGRTGSLIELVGAVVCLALVTASGIAVVRNRSSGLRCAAGLAVLILLGLATSSNLGTGFELPAVALLVPVAIAGVRERPILTAGLIGIVGVAAGFQLLGAGSLHAHGWVRGYPGRQQLFEALDAPTLIDSPSLNRDIVQRMDGRPFLLLRDDAAVNFNALRWYLPADHSAELSTIPFGAACVTPSDLSGVHQVIWGSTAAPYHSGLNAGCVHSVLTSSGFSVHTTLRLSAANTVEIWSRPDTALP